MDVRNCRSCGRLFNYVTGIPICDGCKKELEEKFQEVKEYIRNYNAAPVNQVSEACGVSVKQIKQWVREERLVLSDAAGFFLECENCGAAIRTGRFCDKCKNKLEGELRGAYVVKVEPGATKSKSSGKDRMRFLDL